MRLLLIEDDHPLADVFSRALQQVGYVIDWAKNRREADAWLAHHHYDAVLLDLGLPDADGAEVLRRLRAAKKRVPVLVVSARERVDERVRLLNLGADDYVVKPIALNELEARIRSLIRRSHGLAEPELVLGALRINTASRRATLRGTLLDLGPKELAALQYLVLRARHIVTKELLLQTLYGWDDDIESVNAVEKVVSRLRAKLEGSNVLIRTVRGLGYCMETSES